jgi:hypothetical protein
MNFFNNSENKKYLFLVLIIYFLPFINFVNNNFHEIKIILGISFYVLILLFALFLMILSYLFYLLLRNKISYLQSVLSITLFNWFLFKHNLVNLNLKRFIDEKFASEFALLILIIVSVFTIFNIVKKNQYFLKFINIFFIVLFTLTSFELVKKTLVLNKTTENDYINKNVKLFNDKLNLEKQNIYFFILDGMQPIKDFKKINNLSLNKFLKFINNNKFVNPENTKNFYGNTNNSVSAMFYLDTIFVEKNGTKIFKKNRRIVFPTLMRDVSKSDLMNNLSNLGYNFKWVGNFFAYCPKYNLKYCLDSNKNIYIDTYLYINFFRQSPAIQAIWAVSSLLNYDFNKNFFYKLNDGMGRLLRHLEFNKNQITDNKPTFYFVHHMSPHWPYITNYNCDYKYYPGDKNMAGYKNAYLCNLKKIEETITFINYNDPNAFVVFQSDHNWEMSRKDPEERKKIFNLIKVNNGCEIDESINMNNVNTLKYILSCITDDNPNYLVD